MKLLRALFILSSGIAGALIAINYFPDKSLIVLVIGLVIGGASGKGFWDEFILEESETEDQVEFEFEQNDLDEVAELLHEIRAEWTENLLIDHFPSTDGTAIISKVRLDELKRNIDVDFNDLTEDERQELEDNANRILNCL